MSERRDVWTAAGGDVGTHGSDLHVKVESSRGRADLSCARISQHGGYGERQ